jgi:hypothetical protein
MKKFVLFLAFWAVFCFVMLSSADVTLDLSNKPGQIEMIQVSMNIDQIVLRNYLPAMFDQYKIKIEVLEFVPPPLSFPSGSITEASDCPSLQGVLDEFNKFNKADIDAEWEKCEKILVDKYNKIQVEINNATCKNETVTSEAKKILSLQNNAIGGPFVMKEGDQIAVTVTRGRYTWTYSIFRPHGNWFVSYGFSFISPIIFKPDKYFITDNPDVEQTFLLKESQKKDGWYNFEFIPSLFFWWMPAKARRVNLAPTAGLGFDMQSPVVFFGAALVYNYNIGVNFGIVFHKLNFLKERYAIEDDKGDFPSAGTMIKENLSDDQLYDQKYRFNLFISITYRFGSNPFDSDSK